MKVDKVGPELVQKALRAIRTGKNFPNEMLELGFLQASAGSRSMKIELFYDFVRRYTEGKLRYYRRLFGISPKNLQKRLAEGDSKLNHSFDKDMLRLLACAQLAVDDDGLMPNAENAPGITKLFIRADIEALNANLNEWTALYHRYIEADVMLSINELHSAARTEKRTFQRWVDDAINRLTDAIIKEELEFQRGMKKFQFEAEQDLANYGELFGTEEILQQINRFIHQKDGLKFISIEGLGGIGKTSITHAFVRELAKHSAIDWDEIYWLSARNEWYNQRLEIQRNTTAIHTTEDIINQLLDKLALAHLKLLSFDEKISQLLPFLSRKKFLIIIDNLEILDDGKVLIEKLMPVSGASRFVLTSRESLAPYGQVQSIAVPELSYEFAKQLLFSELNRLNDQRQLSADEFQVIYENIGGIPLAIKLMAALLDCFPTEDIIREFKLARAGGQHEQMFRYIYRRTWSLLSDDARKLLLTMFDMDPNGTSLEFVRHFALRSGLQDEGLFIAALKNLRAHSLLEISGDSQALKYRLHRLTLSFLRTDILHR